MKKIILAIFLISSPTFAAIFGADDRVSIHPSLPGFQAARATAIAVLTSLVEDQGHGTFKLHVDPPDGYLCSNQKFSQEPLLNYACSGFLIAPDLIVTAGHCMVNTGEAKNEKDMYCQAYSWLFDYHRNMESPQSVPTEGISYQKLYECEEVVYAVKDEAAPFRDYALVRLKRAVQDRSPLKIATSEPAVQAAVTMIGYPFGMSAKLSRNAVVLLNNLNQQSFITNLDAFVGNSGSAVLNHKNEVVGILVAGTPSANLIKDSFQGRTCHRYNRCDKWGNRCEDADPPGSEFPGFQRTGSEVQRIGPIRDLLEKLRQL